MSARVTKITMLVDTAQGQASVAEMNVSLTGNEKAFQANAAVASASLTRMLTVKNALAVQSASVSGVIKAENEQMAALSRALQAGVITNTEYAAASGVVAASLQSNLVLQRELTVATAQSNASLKQLTPSVNSVTPAVDAATSAWSRHTNMINTGQGPLRGYDALVQAVARSMGGIPIAAAVAIPLVLALAQAFFKAGEEKKENIKLDNDQIEVDARLWAAMNTGTLFTKEYARVLHDRSAISLQLKDASAQLSAAQADERDAIAKSSTTARDYAASTSDLQTKIAAYTVALFGSVKGESEAIAARQKGTKALDEHIDASVRLAAVTGQTAAALLAERTAAGATTIEIERLTAALDNGALAQARFRAGRGLLGDVRAQVAQEAAAAGVTLTHAEAVKRFNAELARRGDETVKLGRETALAETNLKAFNEAHHSGAGAARAYANALVDLRKRAQEAEAALGGDSFARRAAVIEAQMTAERAHLKINARDKAAALEALAQIEHAQIEKVARDRTEAEQRVMVEIARIHIEAGEDEIQKKKQMMDLELALRSVALKKEFGDTTQTADLIVLYRRAKEVEYERWYLDLWGKADAARLEAERQMMDEIEAERLKRDKKILDDAMKREIAAIKRIGEIAHGLRVDLKLATPAQIELLRRLDDQLVKIGVDVRRVDQIFGSASRSVAELSARIQVLSTKTPAQMDQLKNKIDLVRESFMAVFNAVGAGFEAMISGSESFGRAFLKSILSALGQIAAAWGAFFIATGVGELFLPGAHHAGVVHIAQGAILLALAGALAGAAGLVGKGGSSGAAGGGGGSGASSDAGLSPTATPRDQVVQPKLLDVATSPKSSFESWADRAFGENRRRADQEAINRRNAIQADSGPITIELHLGAGEATNFLQGVMDGKGVIRLDNLGQNKQRIRRALGVQL